MAEYYPLISRAVAGLRAGKPEARQAIYDRARQALVAQLRAMDPPVPEEAITRETTALDDAIARTEAEIAAAVSTPSGGDMEPRPAPPTPPAPPAPPPLKPAAPPPVQPPRAAWRRPTEAPIIGGAQRDGDAGAATTPPPVSRPIRPPPLPRSAVRTAPGEPASEGSPSADMSSVPGMASTAQDKVSMPAAAALRVEPVGPTASLPDTGTDVGERAGTTIDAGDPKAGRDGQRDESLRPAAPRPVQERRTSLRVWVVAVAALVAVVVIAVTAWRLRDKPEDLARTSAPTQAAQTAPDKIVERANDGDTASTSSTAALPARSVQASQTTDATPATSPAATPAGTADDAGTTTAATAAVTPAAAPAPAAAPPSEASLPIAYKAAILVDAPDLPEKVKTYVGTVVWHSESVPTGQGQPLGLAIQADISIPEANMQLMMQIRRNTEAQLPASHTIDLKFTLGTGSPIGSIKQVSVPQMRKQDMPTGDPLAGIPVTIADNYFLVGLVRGAAEQSNLELLRSRQWIDIPLLLGNGKASKVTFEKGANGERIFNEVLDSWKTAPN